MKYLRILLIAILLMPLNVLADKPKHAKKGKKRDKTEWLQKMHEVKHKHLVKELDLTDKQQEEFFKLYDAKESERHAVESNVRNLEKQIKQKGDAATEQELDAAITAQYQLNHDIARIEAKYEKAFRKVLTNRQLFNLRAAERGFRRKLMQHRHDCPPQPRPR